MEAGRLKLNKKRFPLTLTLVLKSLPQISPVFTTSCFSSPSASDTLEIYEGLDDLAALFAICDSFHFNQNFFQVW